VSGEVVVGMSVVAVGVAIKVASLEQSELQGQLLGPVVAARRLHDVQAGEAQRTGRRIQTSRHHSLVVAGGMIPRSENGPLKWNPARRGGVAGTTQNPKWPG